MVVIIALYATNIKSVGKYKNYKVYMLMHWHSIR